MNKHKLKGIRWEHGKAWENSEGIAWIQLDEEKKERRLYQVKDSDGMYIKYHGKNRFVYFSTIRGELMMMGEYNYV